MGVSAFFYLDSSIPVLSTSLQVYRAMSKKYVKVSMTVTLREAIKFMEDGHQSCVLVVDDADFLEGILTYGDVKRCLSKKTGDPSKGDSLAPDVCFSSLPLLCIPFLTCAFLRYLTCAFLRYVKLNVTDKRMHCFLCLHSRDNLPRARPWPSNLLSGY